jgi:hypothetical protein
MARSSRGSSGSGGSNSSGSSSSTADQVLKFRAFTVPDQANSDMWAW